MTVEDHVKNALRAGRDARDQVTGVPVGVDPAATAAADREAYARRMFNAAALYRRAADAAEQGAKTLAQASD